MHHIVFVAHFGDGRGGGFDFAKDLVDAAFGVGIEHEELAGVGARVAQELEAVGLGTGERLLVTEDDAGGIVFELAGADEAAARALLAAAGHGVFLGVGVKRGRGILRDDIVANPMFERVGVAGVDVILGRIIGIGAALFDGDQVVGVGGIIF